MEITTFTTKNIEYLKDIQELVDRSALTFEVKPDEDESLIYIIDSIHTWLRENKFIELNANPTFHTIDGELMNKLFDARYPEGVQLISIHLAELINIQKLALARFSVGGRWMDDIIENLRMRHQYMNDNTWDEEYE